MNEFKKKREGIILDEEQVADTSPANDLILEEKEEDKVSLNNASAPTPEEEENAGIVLEAKEEIEEMKLPEEAENEAPVLENEVFEDEEGDVENAAIVDPHLGIAETSTEKMFTQSQVDEIAGKARKAGREKALRDTFARYGVDSEEGLDELFGDAQRLATLQVIYDTDKKAWEEADLARNTELSDVKERIALLESGIDKARYEDAKLILKGKGLDVSSENILKELETHPEWKPALEAEAETEKENFPFKKKAALPFSGGVEGAGSQIKILGNRSDADESLSPEMSEREKAMNLFFRNGR